MKGWAKAKSSPRNRSACGPSAPVRINNKREYKSDMIFARANEQAQHKLSAGPSAAGNAGEGGDTEAKKEGGTMTRADLRRCSGESLLEVGGGRKREMARG